MRAHTLQIIFMIVPLNLPPNSIKRLHSLQRIPQHGYYIEEVCPLVGASTIIFVSPQSKKKSSKGLIRLSGLEEQSPEEFLSTFEVADQKDSLALLEIIGQSKNYRLMLEVCLRALADQDKTLHVSGITIANLVYQHCTQSERERIRQAIELWLSKCAYKPLPLLLNFVENILAAIADDAEWRFIERVVVFCMYIKSPELTNKLNLILKKVALARNVVLYISDTTDAHFTDYLQPMERKIFFVPLDLIVSLHTSPQGYPIPTESVFMLFNCASFIWLRKPSGLPRGTTPLEKFTKREIEQFADQLRVKYKEKVFPQNTLDDFKLVYFESLAKFLQVVKICESHFENSTYLWANGDFIKPLRTQAVFTAKAEVEQSFSPFLYSGDSSIYISVMPPVIRQRNLPKEYEIRGTFFRNEASCVRIDTPKLEGARGGIDWRYSSGVPENMYPFDLPENISTDLIQCFTKMGLLFCTFDLVFDGIDYFLLDVNHNGQWIFSDKLCDMKITRKMLEYLGNQISRNEQSAG